MKVTVLVENTTCRSDLLPQHGLSLYLETGGRKILFDMGQDDTFLRNARTIGIDLTGIDMAILSHGHYDHGGGLAAFLACNDHAPVYVHRHAFGEYYNGTEKYIGLDPSLRDHPRLHFVEGSCSLDTGLQLLDCNGLSWKRESWGLNRREDARFLPDAFYHEHYLLIKEGEKRILISGCSHKGIENIALHFRPHVLIGGFHLNKQEDTQVLERTAQRLLDTGALYYTGHCTGMPQFAQLRRIMGERLNCLSTGLCFEV